MKRLQNPIRRRAHLGAILAMAPALFLLASITPALGKKGGNGGGGGGGGEDPPAVELVPAPVEYQITWIDWPEPTVVFWLEDINAFGHAVGWCRPGELSTGKNIGILADPQGNVEDLNDVFAVALQNYPGWRFNAAEEINANGDIAGVLVPDAEPSAGGSNETIIVRGNIYAEPPTLTPLDHLNPNSFHRFEDLSETGDVLLRVGWHGESPEEGGGRLYLYSGANPRVVVPTPALAGTSVTHGGVNGAGQVAYTLELTTTTTQTRGKKTTTTETRTYHCYLWDTDGSLTDLGQIGGKYGDSHTGISEEGYVYTSFEFGDSLGEPNFPHQWSPVTGSWEQIAPDGYLENVSKAAFAEECLFGNWLMYQRDYGTFSVDVTLGTQADLDRLATSPSNPLPKGISRPTGSGSGYLCGKTTEWVDGVSVGQSGFILTPFPVAQPAQP